MNTARRVLLIDDHSAPMAALREVLEATEFELDVIAEASLLVARAIGFSPNLIVMPATLRGLSGQIARDQMRSFGGEVPIAMLMASPTETDVLRAIWAGAAEVLIPPFTLATHKRIEALLADLKGRSPEWAEARRLTENLLGIYRRSKRTGVLRLNPNTPFEGQASFDDGVLMSAEYGPLTGAAALQEMLWFDEGVWRFEGDPWSTTEQATPTRAPAAVLTTQVPPAALPSTFRPRVLCADDEPDIRLLYEAQLTAAGFDVVLAHDGEHAATLATRDFDLVMSDIDMPRLDGWGLLRAIKGDYRTRELPVVFLSGQDDTRETLKAARSGAHDYLPKTLRSEAVVRRAVELMAPYSSANAILAQGRALAVDLNVLGAQWLLRQLSTLKLTGTLEVHDEWGSYSVRVRDGEPVDAVSSTFKRQAVDLGALAALLVAKGAQGTFTPGPVAGAGRFNQPMGALLAKVCDMLSKLEAQVVTSRLRSAKDFVVDEALYELFLRVGSTHDVAVARAVCEEHLPPSELAQRLALPAEAVEHGLKEMLRRQVIRFPAASPAVV